MLRWSKICAGMTGIFNMQPYPIELSIRYLRDWCGVGTTYFAMDDETGIGSTQRDPWKWCQVTTSCSLML
jgi:hypothetical protein